jgi:hypothetical protein
MIMAKYAQYPSAGTSTNVSSRVCSYLLRYRGGAAAGENKNREMSGIVCPREKQQKLAFDPCLGVTDLWH